MTVYVDNARIPARVGRVSGRWSHLTADTQDELHGFAAGIGLRRGWFQTCKRSCHSSLPCVHWHYDVTEPRRAAAVAAGAVEIDIREMAAITSARRAALKADDFAADPRGEVNDALFEAGAAAADMAAEQPAVLPPGAAEEFARSRAEGRDAVESAARALIPGLRDL